MTWKSTAVVSGVGLLATWLASVPPANTTASSAAARATATPVSAEATDIRHEADRLAAHLAPDVEFTEPERNPFRFSQRAAAPGEYTAAAGAATPVAIAPVAPPPVVIRLSGVAIDEVAGREERTAILNTPTGMVFAKEGDTVAGIYKVGKIAEEGVDLIRADGSVLQLR